MITPDKFTQQSANHLAIDLVPMPPFQSTQGVAGVTFAFALCGYESGLVFLLAWLDSDVLDTKAIANEKPDFSMASALFLALISLVSTPSSFRSSHEITRNFFGITISKVWFNRYFNPFRSINAMIQIRMML